MNADSVLGVILAGGRSSRMGRDKATLSLGGESLVERQLRVLGGAGVSEVAVSRAPGHPPLPVDLPVIPDEEPHLGPLSGIVAALEGAGGRPVLILAVDMAAVDSELVRRIVEVGELQTGAAPRSKERWEPLLALYPPGALPAARAEFMGPRRSPSALVQTLFDAGLMRPFHPSPAEAEMLRSWNDPEDLPKGPMGPEE